MEAQRSVQQNVKKTLEEGFKSLYDVVRQRLGLSHPAFFRGSNTIASKDDVEMAKAQAKKNKQPTTHSSKKTNQQNTEGVSLPTSPHNQSDTTQSLNNFDDDLFAPDIDEE